MISLFKKLQLWWKKRQYDSLKREIVKEMKSRGMKIPKKYKDFK